MKFSIITINYNNKEGLQKTIESIVNQSYKDFEYIVIDGGSTDGSIEIIKKYSQHINYWVSEHDKGIYNAMNKGIMQAHGDYLNFLNSGDYYYNNDILQMISNLSLNTDIITGKDLHQSIKGEKFASILPKSPSVLHFYRSTIPHQSSFIKRKLFENNKYDEELKIVGDWKFFMQSIIFEGASITFLQNIVAVREQGGISAQEKEKVMEEREAVIKQLFPIGLISDMKKLKYIQPYSYNILLESYTNKKLANLINNIFRVISKII